MDIDNKIKTQKTRPRVVLLRLVPQVGAAANCLSGSNVKTIPFGKNK